MEINRVINWFLAMKKMKEMQKTSVEYCKKYDIINLMCGN